MNKPPGLAEAFGTRALNNPNTDPHRLADETSTLAILLQYSRQSWPQSTLARARSLMEEFGNLGVILHASHEALMKHDLSFNDITLLKTVLAAQLHVLSSEIKKGTPISSWEQLTDYLTAACSYNKTESFRIFYLDRRNHLIRDEEQAKGTIDHVPVYPREVIKRALELNASAIILAHNHPSGDPRPSEADVHMTADIVEAAKLLGIEVHDHVIVGHNKCFTSMRAEGLMP